MKAAYLITIATATLWSCVLCAPSTGKVPDPKDAHKHMPKIVAAYEDLRNKFEALKKIMTEVKDLGYTSDLKEEAAVKAEEKTKDKAKGGDMFSNFIHMPSGSAGTDTGKSIDDAPVAHHMTPSERMKLLSKKYHASHSGPGSMLHSDSSGATSKPGSDSSPAPGAPTMDNLKSALAHLKNDLKETFLSETPVANPNTKTKDKVDVAEAMRSKLKIQDRLKKYRQDIKDMYGAGRQKTVHRVGEILPPVLLNRKGYNRIKRSAGRSKISGFVTISRRRTSKNQAALDRIARRH